VERSLVSKGDAKRVMKDGGLLLLFLGAEGKLDKGREK
jgi:hypothetical protein